MEKMEVKHLMLSKQRKRNIEYLIGIERLSGRMDEITPIYVSRVLNVPLEEVERVMKEMNI